eukprot:scpid49845/ scgid15791/ 
MNRKAKNRNPAEYEQRPLMGPPRNTRLENASDHGQFQARAPNVGQYAAADRSELPRIGHPNPSQRRRPAPAPAAADGLFASETTVLYQDPQSGSRMSSTMQDMIQRLLALTMTTIPGQVEKFRADAALLSQSEMRERKQLVDAVKHVDRLVENLRRESFDSRQRLTVLQDEGRRGMNSLTRASHGLDSLRKESHDRLGRLESSVRQLKDDQKGHAQLTEKANVGRRKEVEAMVENIKELNEQITQVTGQLAQLQKDDAINRDRLGGVLEDLQINGIANEETASSYAELKRSMEKLRRDGATEHQKFEELVTKKLKTCKGREETWRKDVEQKLEVAAQSMIGEVRNEQSWRSHLDKQLSGQIGQMADARKHADDMNRTFIKRLDELEKHFAGLVAEMEKSRDTLRQDLKAELGKMKEAVVVL